MANLTRSAKSSSNWTLNDLDSYHISINQVDPLTFFGLKELPQPSVDQELFSHVDSSTIQRDHLAQAQTAQLIDYLDLAMTPDEGQSGVVDFTRVLFKALNYSYGTRLARTRVDLPLLICNESRHAKTDVCIFDSPQKNILLVVQANKRSEREEPEPNNARTQLVAAAVAAFNKNNEEREAIGRPPLMEKVMPGIVIVGTSPIFFKIPVTQTLSTHIRHGTYPSEKTHVTYCYPSIARPSNRHSEGMKPLDNRREILKCYEAFKGIVGV